MAAADVGTAAAAQKKVRKSKASTPKARKYGASNKPKSARPEPLHPSYIQMVTEAIVALRERGGSSQYAIAKYIEGKYKSVLPGNFKKILSVQLKNLVKQGKLIRVKASFKLSEVLKKTVGKGPKKPDSAALKPLKPPKVKKVIKPKAPKSPKSKSVAKPKVPKKAKSAKGRPKLAPKPAPVAASRAEAAAAPARSPAKKKPVATPKKKATTAKKVAPKKSPAPKKPVPSRKPVKSPAKPKAKSRAKPKAAKAPAAKRAKRA